MSVEMGVCGSKPVVAYDQHARGVCSTLPIQRIKHLPHCFVQPSVGPKHLFVARMMEVRKRVDVGYQAENKIVVCGGRTNQMRAGIEVYRLPAMCLMRPKKKRRSAKVRPKRAPTCAPARPAVDVV